MYHFTAPCVRPETMKRCPIINNTNAGKIDKAAAAAICVYRGFLFGFEHQ
jgi:hypothetical protein